MDIKEVIESLEKFENDVLGLTFRETCALDDTIQVLEKYMKEGENLRKMNENEEEEESEDLNE